MTSDTEHIPFNKPFISGKELEYIGRAVHEHEHLSGNGPFTHRCQEWLEKRLGCRHALLTHTCTAALEMAVLLAEIGDGDEVIMPSFTHVSTANPFVLRGAVPVFVDIRPDTLNIDERLVEQAITTRTRAIVPVHYAGVGCSMDALANIAEHRDLIIIEDAAMGLLATQGGRFLGTIGQMGCISFHETKNVICGEGGALLINDDRFMERADIILEKGTDRRRFNRGEVDKYTWVDIGSSYSPGELTAAFLCAQFEQADTIMSHRRELFTTYSRILSPLANTGAYRIPPHETHESGNCHIFYLIMNTREEREGLIQHLAGQSIHAVFHYVPLHSSKAGKRFGRVSGTMKHTDSLSDRILRLPLYNSMTPSEVTRVAEAVAAFFSQ
ncbi:dTDP-4-amino-4,6-dideoxygalactose transaminase [Candidatus Latescibacterota bacterium]